MPKPKTRISRPKPKTGPTDTPATRTKTSAPKATASAPRTANKTALRKPRKRAGKPNFIVRIWNETRGELRKVVWPTWAEVRYLTVVVLLVTFLTSAFFGLADWLFLRVVGWLIGV